MLEGREFLAISPSFVVVMNQQQHTRMPLGRDLKDKEKLRATSGLKECDNLKYLGKFFTPCWETAPDVKVARIIVKT